MNPTAGVGERPAKHLPPAAAELFAELTTMIFIGALATLAHATGLVYILFPEIGALSFDVLRRPHGIWARAPVMLVVTPILTGLLGTLITQHLAYTPVAVLLTVGGAIIIIAALRSPVAPAISAGLLPLSLNITSWWYPASLVIGLGALAFLSLGWRRLVPPPADAYSVEDRADDMVERVPRRYGWLPAYAMFIVVAAVAAQTSGWHLLLFPPLAVIAYEMFAHPEACPWAGRLVALPVACTTSALVGVMLVHWLGSGPLAAAIAILFGMLLLRTLRLHVPPALAVGLLPFVVEHPGFDLPLAVASGTMLLSVSFAGWRRLSAGH